MEVPEGFARGAARGEVAADGKDFQAGKLTSIVPAGRQ